MFEAFMTWSKLSDRLVCQIMDLKHLNGVVFTKDIQIEFKHLWLRDTREKYVWGIYDVI